MIEGTCLSISYILNYDVLVILEKWQEIRNSVMGFNVKISTQNTLMVQI